MRKAIGLAMAAAALVLGSIAGYLYGRYQKSVAYEQECKQQLEQQKQEYEKLLAAAKPEGPACTDREYVVVKSDGRRGLWGIAEREYGGRGYLYPLIAEASGIKAPYNFFEGQKLKIPCCLCSLPQLAKVTKPTATPKKSTPKVNKPKPECPCPTSQTVPSPVVKQVQEAVVTAASVPVQSPAPAAPAPPVQVAEAPKPAPPPPQAPPKEEAKVIPLVAQATSTQETKKEQPRTIPTPVLSSNVVPEKSTKVDLPLPPDLIVASVWDTYGLNPIEPGNLVDYFHADLGAVVAHIGKVQVEPYLGFNAVKDSKGFSWNNRREAEAGLKFALPVSLGIIEFGAAYAGERRDGMKGVSAQTKMGPKFYGDGWLGWQQPTARKSARTFFPGATPGTFQWVAGNISPFERNNLIGVARLDQGFTLAKVKGISFIPTGNLQVGFDTDKNPWNNRYSFGGGLKIAFPWRTGTFDVQGGYICTEQYRGAPQAATNCGLGYNVDIWLGVRRKLGGR